MRFERLDLNLLVALDALIEDRSVSIAARRLFLSQPALSGALNRLREYFRDDLLVPSGRQMILTPKALELREPVRQALMFIKSQITTPLAFDPATAQRHFTLVASDYAYSVLLSGVLADASHIAPGLTFDVEPSGKRATGRFERGEVDLLLTISKFMSKDHPRVPLYADEHAVICWSGGIHAGGLTPESFLAAGHAVAFFGSERHPAFTETHFTQQGIDRRIEVRVPFFSALPGAVVGTNRVATMYRRHAEIFATMLPITIHKPPLAIPETLQEAQWHSLRVGDLGLRWLTDLVRRHARQMSNPLPADDDIEPLATAA